MSKYPICAAFECESRVAFQQKLPHESFKVQSQQKHQEKKRTNSPTI